MNSLDAWLNFFKDFDLPDTIAQDYAIYSQIIIE